MTVNVQPIVDITYFPKDRYSSPPLGYHVQHKTLAKHPKYLWWKIYLVYDLLECFYETLCLYQ